MKTIKKLKKTKGNLQVFIVLTLLSLPSIWGLLRAGFFEPHDTHHLADIYEMWRAFMSGQFPPRLGPDFSFGYGYPLFNFYYLLPFYLGAFFYALLGSLTLSLKMVFIFGSLVSVYGMYLFLKEFFGKYPSIAGAVLFLYTPYRAVQIYVRGAVGEAIALAILPWVLWGVGRLVRVPTKINFGILSLITFFFIISHNYFFALTIPLIFVFLFFVSTKLSLIKKVGLFFYSLTLSLVMASYWLVPAIFEKRFVKTDTPFPLLDHFPFIKQLIIPSWGYGSSVWGPTDEISFQIGIVNIFAVILGIWILVFRRAYLKRNNIGIFWWSLFGFAISLIFMNIRTYELWKILPFHNLIQFPWRLLVFTTFFTSVILAFILNNLKTKFLTFVFILISIFLTYPYFKGSHYVKTSDEEYLERFFNDKNYSEDYLLLPIWTESRSETHAQKVFNSENKVIISEKKITPIEYEADITVTEDELITVHKDYFFGWNVYVDGVRVYTTPVGKHGEFQFTIEAGTSHVLLKWEETKLRKFFDYLSLLAISIVNYLIFWPKSIKK